MDCGSGETFTQRPSVPCSQSRSNLTLKTLDETIARRCFHYRDEIRNKGILFLTKRAERPTVKNNTYCTFNTLHLFQQNQSDMPKTTEEESSSPESHSIVADSTVARNAALEKV